MSRFQIAVLTLLGLIACTVCTGTTGLGALMLIQQPTASARQSSTTPPPATVPSPAATATPVSTATSQSTPTNTQVVLSTGTPTAMPTTTNTPVPPTSAPTDTAPPLSPSEPTPNPALPDQNFEPAQVTNVVDGDTIDVLLNGVEYRVRYILIDTPETKHPSKGVQPFGPEASAANRQMVADQTVYLEKDVSETDRYDRLLRYVYLDDGRLVNEELLRLGLAQVSTYPPDVKYVDRFRTVQREAQANEVGLWGAAPVDDAPSPDLSPSDVTVITGASSVAIVEVDKRTEYVDLHNGGAAPVDLSGWQLVSEKGNQACALGGVIGPGERLRVWALADDVGKGGYNCGFDSNIWNNSKRDPAVLFDAAGAVVSRME